MRILRSAPNTQDGFAHLGLILAIVGVVAVGGLVAWRYMGASNPLDNPAGSLGQKLAGAKCDYDDKNLCKFFVSWKNHSAYRLDSDSTDKKTNEKTKATYEVDGDNSHYLSTGQYASEMIYVGKLVTFIKAADGTWWKQTRTDAQQPGSTVDVSVDFKEPEADGSPADSLSYKALDKEACGSLTCFKYQVVDATQSDVTQYLWFDTKDYQLRRTTYENDDSTSDMSFSYDNVGVKIPTNFKELGPNQYLLPGQSQPTTIPSAADYQN